MKKAKKLPKKSKAQAYAEQSEKAKRALGEWFKEDWVNYIEYAGGITWSGSREIIRSVQNNQLTAVQAAHGVGKTHTAAQIAVAFYNLFPNGKVITTAPTSKQVKKLLWKEINNMYRTSIIKPVGVCTQFEITNPDNPAHFGFGFSTDNASSAEGFHAFDILYIFDEAKGIPEWMWDSARGALTEGNWRWLVISTTDGVDPGSQYYRCFQAGSAWNKIKLSAYDTPPSTGEPYQVIQIPDLANMAKWKRVHLPPEKIKIQLSGPGYIKNASDSKTSWGVDSPLYVTKVLGEFASQSPDCIVKMSDIYRAFANYENEDFDRTGKKRGGIDPAGGGKDSLVAWRGTGNHIDCQPLVISTPDLPAEGIVKFQCDQIEKFYNYEKKKVINTPRGPVSDPGYELKIDATGLGLAVVSEMQTRGWTVIPIHFGEAASDIANFDRVPEEMWYNFAHNCPNYSIPNNEKLLKQLVGRKAGKLTTAGKLTIETKDKYKERYGGESCDFADAIVLYFYEPHAAGPAVFESDQDFY